MSRKKRRDTPEWQWEQELIDAYYDYRWHQVLDPLFEKFQQWKAGALEHEDMNEAIHATQKPRGDLFHLFTEKRDFLLVLIQMDRWSDRWLLEHPAPPGVKLIPRTGWPFEDDAAPVEVEGRDDASA